MLGGDASSTVKCKRSENLCVKTVEVSPGCLPEPSLLRESARREGGRESRDRKEEGEKG